MGNWYEKVLFTWGKKRSLRSVENAREARKDRRRPVKVQMNTNQRG